MKTRNILTGLALTLAGAVGLARGQDYLNYELRTPEEARQIYGDNIPEEVKYSIDDIYDDINLNTGSLSARVEVGNGRFVSERNGLESYLPLEINGQGADNSSIDARLWAYDGITLSGLEFEKLEQEIGFNSAVLSKYGELSVTNCRFKDWAFLYGDSSENYTITNNEFEDIQGIYAIKLIQLDEEKTTEIVDIKRNIFKNVDKAIFSLQKINAGTSNEIGENIFEDCNVAFYNYYEGEQNFEGNYIITSDEQTLKDGSQRVILTLEDALETGQIVNESQGTINFTGLRWRPLPRMDWNDDEKIDAVDVQHTINEALGIENPYMEYPDANKDGTCNAVDIQMVINEVLGIE